jgi:hypothetical protein
VIPKGVKGLGRATKSECMFKTPAGRWANQLKFLLAIVLLFANNLQKK